MSARFITPQRKSNFFISTLFCFVLLILLPTGALFAQEETEDALEIGIDEKLGEFIPLDLAFTDEHGDSLFLRDYIDRPIVLSLVYYNCPGICSPLLSGMVDVLDNMDLKPGVDYKALTISFAPNETFDLGMNKKKNYFKAFKKGPFPEAHWKWAVGDSITIAKISNAVGFRYKKVGSEYAHAGAIYVISPEGKIARYLRGIIFQPFDLKMAITEAAEGRTGPTISKLLLYCYSFDPEGRSYVFNVTKVAGTGFLIFLVILIAFLTLWKTGARKQKAR